MYRLFLLATPTSKTYLPLVLELYSMSPMGDLNSETCSTRYVFHVCHAVYTHRTASETQVNSPYPFSRQCLETLTKSATLNFPAAAGSGTG